jgi:hypothetical protein
MKSLLLTVLFLTIATFSNAQSTQNLDSLYEDLAGSHDELLAEMEYMDEKIASINLHLEKAHVQYRTGTHFVVGGILLQGIAVLFNSSNPSGLLLGLGTLSTAVGGVIWIDSHKHFYRAGGKRYSKLPNNINL